jgi:hypothetical protein
MNLTIVPVASSNWTPLQARYGLDPFIELYTNEIVTTDGYRVYNQTLFNNPKNTAVNNDTGLYLPGPRLLLDIMFDRGKDDVFTGGYVVVRVIDETYGTLYLSVNEDNNIYLTSNVNAALSIRTIVNEDESLTFFTADNLRITVAENEPLYLTLEEKLPASQIYRQQFTYNILDSESVTFATKPSNNQRLWGYRTTGPFAFVIRANGLILNEEPNPINNYIFNIPDFANIIRYRSGGLLTEHTWVDYFSDLSDKRSHKNVTLNRKVVVKAQHLVDNPYHMIDMENEVYDVNIANLKSVMTDKYTYVSPPRPSYAITPSVMALDEGENVSFDVDTVNIPDGTQLTWCIGDDSTATSNDFINNQSQGLITINDNTATFTLSAAIDAITEGPEFFTIVLKADNEIVATTPIIEITDKTPTYLITPDSLSMLEGEFITFTVDTTNIDDGTILYWTIGSDTVASDFDPATLDGSLTINNNTAQFNISAALDFDQEPDETFKVHLRTGSAAGPIVASTSNITIISPTFAVVVDKTTVREGEQITFDVNTTNYLNGQPEGPEGLWWVIVPVIEAPLFNPATFNELEYDLLGGPSEFEQLLILNNTTQVPITFTAIVDDVLDGAQNFKLELRYDKLGVNKLLATSPVITILERTPTISVSPDKTSVYELPTIVGDTIAYDEVTFTINTTDVPDGTSVFWAVDPGGGLDVADPFEDFGSSSVSLQPYYTQTPAGTVTINGNTAQISLTPLDDLDDFESDELFRIRAWFDDSNPLYPSPVGSNSIADPEPTILGTSPFVTIISPTFSIIATPLSQAEGGLIQFNVVTTGVPDGHTLYYDISSIAQDATGDFVQSLLGDITINNNTALFALNPAVDAIIEGDEDFNINLRSGSQAGPIRASTTFTVQDLPPTYTITADTYDIIEGDPITFTITTTNVADGTVLAWGYQTVLGTVDDSDFDGVIDHTVTINGNTATFTLTSVQDDVTESTETFFITCASAANPSLPVAGISEEIAYIHDVSFTIQAQNSTLIEGLSSQQFIIQTTNVPEGTTVYWTLTATPDASNALEGNIISGSGPIGAGGQFVTPVYQSLFDPDLRTDAVPPRSNPETYTVRVHTGSEVGIIRDTDTFTIADAPLAWSLSSDSLIYSESEEVTYTVNTTSVPLGTPFYWSIYGTPLSGATADDFLGLGITEQGPLTILQGSSATFSRFIKSDTSVGEGPEFFTAEISGSLGGTTLASATTAEISDTGFLNKNTDIYAVFDTTSMSPEDAVDAAIALTAWHDTLPGKIPGYEGGLKISPICEFNNLATQSQQWTEGWLMYPSYIYDQKLRLFGGRGSGEQSWGPFAASLINTPYNIEYSVQVTGNPTPAGVAGEYRIDSSVTGPNKFIQYTKVGGGYSIWYSGDSTVIDNGRWYLTTEADVGNTSAPRFQRTANDEDFIGLAWNGLNGWSGTISTSLNDSDPWYSQPNPNNFVCLAFMDEAATANDGTISYHDNDNPDGVDDFTEGLGADEPTTWFQTVCSNTAGIQDLGSDYTNLSSFRDTLDAMLNSEGGFFRGVLYPIVRGGSSRKMLLHAHGAIYGTTLTNNELFGVGGTYENPAPGGIYSVSDSDPNWVDLRQMTISNPYPNDGLINYGWQLQSNKTQPASDVFSSDSFGDELDDLLTT